MRTHKPRSFKKKEAKVKRPRKVKIAIEEEETPLEAEPIALARDLPPESGADEEDEAEEVVKIERQPYDADTAYTLYLREIGQTKLLTPAEEIVLAERIHRGDEA